MTDTRNPAPKIEKSEAEWRTELTPDQYHVLREKGTERAFTGDYWDTHDAAPTAAPAAAPLFDSDDEVRVRHRLAELLRGRSTGRVATETDRSLGMRRTEALCATAAAISATCSRTGRADRPALLHELGVADPRTRTTQVAGLGMPRTGRRKTVPPRLDSS